jgi:Glycosyl hydrolases family 16
MGTADFLDDFDRPDLDTAVWVPHYLPMWSSRAETGATYALSGEVGSTIGQQPFRDGAVVREFQPTHWGWTPRYGLLEVRARMDLSPRSMAAVGMGVHPFRDPAIIDEFAAERVAIDVTALHVYAADWQPGRVDFLIDGQRVKTVDQAPGYAMQMMIAVFDFPGKATPAQDADHVPALVVDSVAGSRLPAT